MGFMKFFGAKPNPEYKEEPQVDPNDDGVPYAEYGWSGGKINGTFGTPNMDSVFKTFAPVMYKRIQHIEDYAKVHELEGRVAELQKRCDEQSAIISNFMKKEQKMLELAEAKRKNVNNTQQEESVIRR